jgi:SPP1 family predicted phage head-tail adaptor
MTVYTRAGPMRHRVEFQRAETVPNDFGEPVETWATYATRWARVQPLRGRDRWAAQQVNAQVTHEITLRHVRGVKAEHRIKFGDRVFTIEAPVNPEEKGAVLTLPCREEVE